MDYYGYYLRIIHELFTPGFYVSLSGTIFTLFIVLWHRFFLFLWQHSVIDQIGASLKIIGNEKNITFQHKTIAGEVVKGVIDVEEILHVDTVVMHQSLRGSKKKDRLRSFHSNHIRHFEWEEVFHP